MPRASRCPVSKMIVKDSFRDSDVEALYPQLEHLASAVNLPLLVYGERGGCAFPAGCQLASDFYHGGARGLDGDLQCLRSCEVMFAPDSGWADFLRWLQVPTILQSFSAAFTNLALLPFRPRMSVLRLNVPLMEQFHCIRKLPLGALELTSSSSGKTLLIPKMFNLAGVIAG